MPIKLSTQVPNRRGTDYDDPMYRQTVMDHINIIKNNSNAYIDVSPVDALRYKGDLYGLLRKYNTDPRLNWVILVMNGYNSPDEYDGTDLDITLPDEGTLSYIYTLYNTR